jgi:hypothetical protein
METNGLSESREYWPMARAAHIDLDIVKTRRVNLLLVGSDGLIQNVLDRLMPNLREPIETWRPPDSLELRAPQQLGTLILRDVGALPPVDQRRLLGWLELAAGHTQIVSTTPSSLLTRVETNRFLDTLYYRLNTVCVDVTE